MPSRTLALQDQTTLRHYRVELVRTEILIGAHFFDEEISSEYPASFIVSTAEQESFSKYIRLDDDTLFDICIQEFIEPEHIKKVTEHAQLGVSVGKRLP